MQRRISGDADVIESYIGEARREWVRRRRQRARQQDTRLYARPRREDEPGPTAPRPRPDLAERVRRLISE